MATLGKKNLRGVTGRAVRPSRTPMRVAVKGAVVYLYPMCWLAYALKRKADTIRKWEKMGHMPRPLFRMNEHNWRFYTSLEIIGYARLFLQEKFHTHISKSFENTHFVRKAKLLRIELKKLLETNPEHFGSRLAFEDAALDNLNLTGKQMRGTNIVAAVDEVFKQFDKPKPKKENYENTHS